MIDLTKPIRRKKTREVVLFLPEPFYHLIRPGSGSLAYSADELEFHFENVPEPRKPREWHGYVDIANRLIPEGGNLPTYGKYVRVIEWPLGTPLPDWPEGY